MHPSFMLLRNKYSPVLYSQLCRFRHDNKLDNNVAIKRHKLTLKQQHDDLVESQILGDDGDQEEAEQGDFE